MVEAVTVYRVLTGPGNVHTFASAAEATQFESEIVIRPLVETGPFTSFDQGIHWLTANAVAVIAALSPSVPKAPVVRRPRRPRDEIAADKAAKANAKAARYAAKSFVSESDEADETSLAA